MEFQVEVGGRGGGENTFREKRDEQGGREEVWDERRKRERAR